MNQNILEINGLVTAFDTEAGEIHAVDDVRFSVPKGSTLGLVGESGCGKSVTALSIMRLLPQPVGKIKSGQILFDDRDIVSMPVEKLRVIRGRRISMIFQEPMTALNPVHRIGKQISEVFQLHFPQMSKQEMADASVEMLGKVGIPEPAQRMREYPHQLSGGMRQRVMIAMALACKPDILIADEPTTALDVTIQAQILQLMQELQRETGMSVIFITHDLGVIAEICDRVVVMYAGRIAETGPVKEIFQHPAHPYTQGLLSSIPRMETPRKTGLSIIKGMVPSLYHLPKGCRFQNRCPHAQDICKTHPAMKAVGDEHFAACHFSEKVSGVRCQVFGVKSGGSDFKSQISGSMPLVSGFHPPILSPQSPVPSLTVRNLKMHFPVRGGVFMRRIGTVHAVDGISFTVHTGQTLGLVGESGCGKTTVGRSILRLYEPTAGEVIFEGKNIPDLKGNQLQELRRNVQMIFQDPFESLNSRHTVGTILEEPFVIHRIGNPSERREKVKNLLEKVGLSQDAADRFPHEFSGGQRQRIGIARAIALNPRLIVCDEPVSALDVSIQSQILNLLLELQREMGLTYLFISHDLTVVRHISDSVMVMYLGKIAEYTDADTIYSAPLHPYTQALISAIPAPDPLNRKEKQVLTGDIPSPIRPPSGCRFRTRCPIAIEKCSQEEPVLLPAPGTDGKTHLVACHRVK
ncbi:MAG: ABC transporter ATP-binding protein [Desulfobacterales bacterium]